MDYSGRKYMKMCKVCVLLLMFSIVLAFCSSQTDRSDEQTGWLRVEGADLRGHQVLDSDTGKEVGFVSNVSSTIEVPAGIYTVTAGNGSWEDVEVKPGETTVLKPGLLEVENASFRGHTVLDAETDKEHGQISSTAQSITLIPGVYKVSFGNIYWEAEVNAGETTVLNAGLVTVEGASVEGHTIRTADGREVGYVSNTASSFPLPPGDYTIELGGKQIDFSLEEGQTKIFNVE